MSNSVQLGYAEFYRPDPARNDPPGWHGRVLFLKAVQSAVPDVLTKLRVNVLPVYEATLRSPALYPPHFDEWSRVSAARTGFRHHLLPLKTAIRDWAAHFHLEKAQWVFEAANRTLRTWVRGDPTIGCWELPVTVVREMLSREDAKKLKRKKRLHEPSEDIGARAVARGFRRNPQKRKLRHFLALARFQCGGWNQTQLACESDPPVDQPTVRKALERTAEMIGLQLRKAQPGRPRTTAR